MDKFIEMFTDMIAGELKKSAPNQRDTIKGIAYNMASYIKFSDYNNFDKKQFLKDCGIEEED